MNKTSDRFMKSWEESLDLECDVFLCTHLTLGYGSPEILDLANTLASHGLHVHLSDAQDPIRQYYKFETHPLVHRMFRPHPKLSSASEFSEWYQLQKVYASKCKPKFSFYSLISMVSRTFPLFFESNPSLYASEITPESPEADIELFSLITPSPLRTEHLKNSVKAKHTFTIQNCSPLNTYRLGDIDFRERPSIVNGPINICYQGQISSLSGADLLMDTVRENRQLYLHLCGDIRDSRLSEAIQSLVSIGRCTYYGHVPSSRLADIRRRCHLGFIGWRQDLTEDIAIRYACPTKLYDYIGEGMPFIYIENDGISNLCKDMDIGRTCRPSRGSIMHAIIKTCDTLDFKRYAAKCSGIVRGSFNYEHQSWPLVKMLIRK